MSTEPTPLLGVVRILPRIGLALMLMVSLALADAKDKNQQLIEAAANDDVEEVTRLLQEGPDINAKDEFGWTALMRGVESGGLGVVKLLLEKGADVNARTGGGEPALMIAARRDALEVVRLLLENGANVNAKDKGGLTALMIAARRGHLGMVEFLLNSGADIQAKDESGWTALRWAATEGGMHAVRLLKERGSKMTLAAAAALGDVEEVKRLLGDGADVNARDKSGGTPLMAASQSGNLEVVKLLLEKGADVDAKAGALDLAKEQGNKQLETLLRAYGAKTSEALKIARVADKAARRGAELFFRLKDGTVVSALNTASYQGSGYPVSYSYNRYIAPWYVIDEAYYEGYGTRFVNRDTGAVEIIEGYSVFSPDETRFLAVGYPGEFPCDTQIRTLSRTGTVQEWVVEGFCFLGYRWSDHSTVEVVDDHEVIARLHHEGASWRCRGSSDICKRGETPRRSQGKVGAEPKKEHGSGASTKTVERDASDTMRMLLDNSLDVNAKDRDGRTALRKAAGEGRLKVVKLLLQRGADVNAKDEDGRTALMCAAIRGHAAVVKLLLDKGADVNAKDKAGWTALTDAAWGGNPEVVKLLLAKGADVTAKGPYGSTALKEAEKCKHKKIVQMLKAHGAKPHSTPRGEQ